MVPESPVSPNEIKLQMDNVAESARESGRSSNSSSSLGQDSHRQSNASVDGKEVDLSPISVKDEKAKLSYDIYEKKQSFGKLFCNAFKFYGRLTAVCYSYNPRLGRAAKAFNLAT